MALGLESPGERARGEEALGLDLVGGRRSVSLVSSPAVVANGTAPAPALVELRGLALDAEARPVAGLELVFAPRASHGGAERIALESGAAGLFHARVPPVEAAIRAADPRFAAILDGSFDPESSAEPVVVVAPVVRVAGLVEATDGAPLAGARVELVLPEDLFVGFALVLDGATERELATRTDERGAFDLGALPSVPGARLATTLAGWRPDLRDAPAFDDPALRIALARESPEPDALRGLVVDACGLPLAGARVAALGAAAEIALTDEKGGFAFEPEVARRAERLVAAAPGLLPAELRGLADDAGWRWPEHVVLRLEGETRALAGRVVDESARPLAGARVWLADPTLFGLESEAPIQLENVLAGLRPKDAVEAAGEPLDDTPTSLWSWFTTDAEGRFRVPGLLAREYSLLALDLETLALGRAGPFVAGDETLEIVLPMPSGLRRVAGRVATEAGEPVCDARVVVTRHAFTTERPGGGTTSWDTSGASATTDAAGAFALGRVPASGVTLRVSGEGLRGRTLPLDGSPGEDRLEIAVELVPPAYAPCHVQVELDARSPAADRFALLDVDGAAVPLVLVRGGQRVGALSGAIVDGRSLVLAAPAGTFRLVLYQAGVEVAQSWATLVPGELVTLRP